MVVGDFSGVGHGDAYHICFFPWTWRMLGVPSRETDFFGVGNGDGCLICSIKENIEKILKKKHTDKLFGNLEDLWGVSIPVWVQLRVCLHWGDLSGVGQVD
ncbi:hypothetical protein XENTR_v10016619 [Xenopus tropicalis]|nr:hypothetical protein XENTR_v10016619 [Xenopus tropicalis]